MITENLRTLIDKLIDKTASRQAIWSKTSRENEFKLELQKGAITTDNWEDVELGMMTDLSIINEFGDTIERIAFRQKDLANYNIILSLHDMAKRAYYKVDETIKTIFVELDSNEIIGKEHTKDDLPDLPF